jgi:Ni,Fe-hydrogenase I cytochrome b subunit
MFDKTAQLYDLIYSSKNYERESLQINDYIRTLHPQAHTILDVALLIKTLRQFKNHLKVDGIVLVEPWFPPEAWETGRIDIVNAADDKGHKVCRMSHSATEGAMSILNFQYLIGSSSGIEHYTERHELGLFTKEQMRSAFEGAGLACEFDPIGISGRGIYIGKMPIMAG